MGGGLLGPGGFPAAHRHGLWQSLSWPVCLPPPWRLPGGWCGLGPHPALSSSLAGLLPRSGETLTAPGPTIPAPGGSVHGCPGSAPSPAPHQQPRDSAGSSLTMSAAGREDTAQGHQSCCGQSTGQRRPRLSGPGCLGSLGPRAQDPFMGRRSCCPISGQAWPFPAWPLPGSPRPEHPLTLEPTSDPGPQQEWTHGRATGTRGAVLSSPCPRLPLRGRTSQWLLSPICEGSCWVSTLVSTPLMPVRAQRPGGASAWQVL